MIFSVKETNIGKISEIKTLLLFSLVVFPHQLPPFPSFYILDFVSITERPCIVRKNMVIKSNRIGYQMANFSNR